MSEVNKKVFVVHGRNLKARDELNCFLRAIGLTPVEWGQALRKVIRETNNPLPYVGEVLDAGLSMAQAIVVLFTPDDEARLRKQFRDEGTDPPYESVLSGQMRPNVLFEAGLAMGRYPDRTIVVELGRLRPFSDFHGLHTIKLDNSYKKRRDLADRLGKVVGCPPDLSGDGWVTEGDFSPPSDVVEEAPADAPGVVVPVVVDPGPSPDDKVEAVKPPFWTAEKIIICLLGLALVCTAALLAYKVFVSRISYPRAVRYEPAAPPKEWFRPFSRELDREAQTDSEGKRVVGFGRGTYKLSWDGFPDGPSPEPFELILTAPYPYKVKAVAAKQGSSGMVKLEVKPGDKSEEVVVKVPRCEKGDEVYVSVYVSWSEAGYCPNVGEGCCTEVFALKTIDWNTKAEGGR